MLSSTQNLKNFYTAMTAIESIARKNSSCGFYSFLLLIEFKTYGKGEISRFHNKNHHRNNIMMAICRY
jgi:hypothetical protein